VEDPASHIHHVDEGTARVGFVEHTFPGVNRLVVEIVHEEIEAQTRR
jgi:hypothetical protein